MEKTAKTIPTKNVDEYLHALPEEVQITLEKVRQTIKGACAQCRGVHQLSDTELEDFDISGTTIHFTPDKPLPTTFIQKIVKARIKENELNKQKKMNT